MFDPQTCGGLLAAVDPARAPDLLSALRDTGCDSLDGLFGADSRWRQYMERVEGTRAWRLRLSDAPGPGGADAIPRDQSEAFENEPVASGS